MLYESRDERGAVLIDGGIMRLAGAVILYLRHVHLAYSLSTFRGRSSVLYRFVDELGNPALRSIKARHVTDWLAARTCGPSTLRYELSAVRCFFRWAIEHGHCKADPTLLVPKIRQPRAVPRALNLAELTAMRHAAPDLRAEVIGTLMLDLGLRRAEVARLEMADLDFYAEVVRVVGKGGHERMLPMTPMLRHVLGRYLTERGRGSGPLIRSQVNPNRGIGADRVGVLVADWMRAAGVKQARWDGKSAHAMRHSMALNLLRHRVDLERIQAALGHAHMSTTSTYLRPNMNVEDLRAVMGQQFIDQAPPTLQAVQEFDTPRSLSDAG